MSKSTVTIKDCKYIKHPAEYHPEFSYDSPAPMFRRHFEVGAGLLEARLEVSALGVGELYLNGRRVTDDRFVSAFSDYTKTLWYTSYDVTIPLNEGENVAAAMLGNGYFNESLHTPWNFNDAVWRDSPKLCFCLKLRYIDRTEYIVSDGDWLADIESTPCTFNQLRLGEIYDSRLAIDWMKPEFDDSSWERAIYADSPGGEFVEYPCEPIREDKVYECVSLTKNVSGAYVFDFGQNMSGYVRISANQPAGTKLHIVYAEQINPDGTRRDNRISDFYRDGETQFSELITNGKSFSWKPSFSYYGFRYAIIDGFVTEPSASDVQAIFVHQALTSLGDFECSDDTLNRIYRFAKLSTLSNLFNMITDCPTREKLGWCNDAQASCEQMLQNFDMTRFYKKWMRDIYDSMKPDGDLPGIVPTAGWGYEWGSGPVSTGIMFEIPARIYQYTGSTELLTQTYPYMLRHFEFLYKKEIDGGLVAYGLSDWAGPFSKDNPTPVPLEFTTTLLVIKFLRIAKLAAELLGKADDVIRLDEREQYYTNNFRRAYLQPDGRLTLNEQTACAMVIALGIYDDLEPLKAQFYETFEKYDWHIHVGMLGMQYLLPACDICGFEDEGLRLICADGFPSYREWFKSGATTLYEMWYDDESRNHHMYSCPIAWFHNTLLGIRQDERLFGLYDHPGIYTHTYTCAVVSEQSVNSREHIIRVEPAFVKSLDWARGSFETNNGRVGVEWRREDGKIKLSLSIPAGVTAETNIPEVGTLGGGEYVFVIADRS